tara:strand:+ start:480 stop:1025 length:546 start_codon:yes stop_codon:yes gene_type:complete
MTSKLKTDILETVSGSGTIALTNQLSGMTSASVPSGSVVQVVYKNNEGSTNTYFQSTSDTFVTLPNLSTTITPTSTSSKVILHFHGAGFFRGSATNLRLRLLRGSTVVWYADRFMYTESGGTWGNANITNSFVDAPSTTSEITYSLQVAVSGGTNLAFRIGDNSASNNDTMSSMQLIEFKG